MKELAQRILCSLYGHSFKTIKEGVEVQWLHIFGDNVQMVEGTEDYQKCSCGKTRYINKKEQVRKDCPPMEEGKDDGSWIRNDYSSNT